MTTREILSTLKAAGKPQTAAIYKRYGTGDNVFGVLTSEIIRIRKKVKGDHALAMRLKADADSISDGDAGKMLQTIEKASKRKRCP